MTAAMAPGDGRYVASGIVGAVVLHAALLGGLLWAGHGPRPEPPPQAMQFRTQMEAAPNGEPAVGVVQAPEPAAPAPAPRAAETVPKSTTAPTKTPAKPAPKEATVTPNAARSTKAAPVAGSEAGGAGADLVNVDIGGADFPFPTYQRNIINQIAQQFRTSERTLMAEVMFIIRRDGSVDPDHMKVVTSSGKYTFDNAALAAIEAAANKKLFGPLPTGYQGDALTVIFKFDPKLIRP